jgi:hypothetical protein
VFAISLVFAPVLLFIVSGPLAALYLTIRLNRHPR